MEVSGWKSQEGFEMLPSVSAAIEAKDVLVQVALQILRLDPMMRAKQPGRQIAEHAMDVRRLLVSPFRHADDSHSVLVAGKSRVRVSAPAIRSDPREQEKGSGVFS